MDNSNADVLIDAMLEPKAAAKIKAYRARAAKDAARTTGQASVKESNFAGRIMSAGYVMRHATTDAEREAKRAELIQIAEQDDTPDHLREQAMALAATDGTSLEIIKTKAELEAKIVVDGALEQMGFDPTSI